MSTGADQIDAPPQRGVWLAMAIIAAATIVAYLPSFSGAFVFDDFNRIVANPAIQPGSIGELPDIIIDRGRLVRRPLTNITFTANWLIHGLWAPGFHAVNLFIHLAAGLVLFDLIRRAAMRSIAHSRAILVGVIGALLWAVHPLNTQAVTYIVQRSESMMGLFYLSTLYGLLRSVEGGRRWSIMAIGSAFCAIMSKEVAVTLPLTAVLFDRCFLSGSFAAAIKQRGGVHLGIAASWVVLLLSGALFGVLGVSPPANPEFATVGLAYEGATPLTYLMTQSEVLWRYIALALWPTSLSIDYMWPPAMGFGDVAAGFTSLVALGLTTLWLLWKYPRLGFIAAWFFVVLAPTSSVIPIKDPIVEHRMYLALISITVLVALGLLQLSGWIAGRISQSAAATAMGLVLATITVGLIAQTVQRNMVYESAHRVWHNALDQGHDSLRVRQNLADGLRAVGRHGDAINAILPALSGTRRTDVADRAYAAAVYTYAAAQLAAGNAEEASKWYAVVDNIFKTTPAPSRVRGIQLRALYDQATIASRRGDSVEAENTIRRAITLDDTFAGAYYLLGNIYAARRDLARAEPALRRAIELQPAHVDALSSLGGILISSGRAGEGIGYLERAVEEAPTHSRSLYNLGLAYQTIGRRDDALDVLGRISPQQSEHALAQQRIAAIRGR